jgi:hypothetical protein
MQFEGGRGDIVDARKILEWSGKDASLVEKTVGGSWNRAIGGVRAGHGASARRILEGTAEGRLEGLLDFGGRKVRLIVEEIVRVDGGLAGRVEGNGDR